MGFLEVIIHVTEHALRDCLKMLPFLFAAFLILEAVEHYAQDKMKRWLAGMRFAGPLVGAALGCIPQCGFSIVAAGLYSGGVITLGTLLSVFLATSDEAVLILLGHPGSGDLILRLLGTKFLVALISGYLVDLLGRRYKLNSHHIDEICVNCGCHEESGILKPALRHTVRTFLFLLIVTAVLTAAIEFVGEDRLGAVLLRDSMIQPFLAALIGMIPNCASSVLLTELYMQRMISFASAIAGLSTGAGLGLLVLFRTNHHKKENVKVVLLLYGFAVLFGMILEMLL